MKIVATLTVFALLSISMIGAYGQTLTITADKQTFSAGDVIELQGKTDGANKPVTLEIKDPSGETILIRTIQADENGEFDLTFKLPSTAEFGSYDIVAVTEVNGNPITQTTSILQSPKSDATSQDSRSDLESRGGGCLIATAAYGTELAPQIQLLREMRDNTILQTDSGTSFMAGFNSFYYAFSPTVADWERQSPVFKEMVRIVMTPMISTLSILQYADSGSEYEMLGYGIGIILLNVGMYLVAPPAAIYYGKRKMPKIGQSMSKTVLSNLAKL